MAAVDRTHEEKTMPESSNIGSEEASTTENNKENYANHVLADIPVNFKAYCYTCEAHVHGKNALNHLFFGVLDCKLCSFKILNCQRFQGVFKSNPLPCKDSKTEEHEFKWNNGTPDYLSYFKLKELSIERFCSNQTGPPPSVDVLQAVGEYMMSLSSLENHQPWKWGFECCRRNPKLALVLSDYEKSSNDKVNETETKVQTVASSKSLSSEKVQPVASSKPLSFEKVQTVASSKSLSSEKVQTVASSKSLSSVKVQTVASSKSLSSEKDCKYDIKPELYDFKPIKRTNNSTCITAKQLKTEVTESAVAKGCKQEQKEDGNMLCITAAYSIPKGAELVQNENSSESLNSSNNINKSPLRTDSTDSSKDGPCLSQAKQIPKPLISDSPLVRPERNLFDLDLDDPDDPDEVMLQNCSIENLDETVEYVTIDDASEKKIMPVMEEQKSSSYAIVGEDDKEVDALTGKRKSSDMTVNRTKHEFKLLKKFPNSYSKSSFIDFEPPDKISGDHYLVIHYPSQGCPEECPNCYCEFSPSMLTVNCSSYVSTIICADCKLTIYVLQD